MKLKEKKEENEFHIFIPFAGLRLVPLSLDDEESDKDKDDDGPVTLTTVTLDREAVPVPITLIGRHSYNPASSSLTQRILNVERRLFFDYSLFNDN